MTNKDYLKQIGMEFRIARMRKTVSVKEIAKLTGLSLGCIGKLERGDSDVKILTYKRFADALGMGMREFL